MKITPVIEKYIHHWGEMGLRWGTNRTVAQIQALLYLSPNPLSTKEISNLLSVAQSHVSTSLRELQNYGVVKMTHIAGDRDDYFESIHDVWELFRVIIEQRKQKELSPTLIMLNACSIEIEKENEAHQITRERIHNMLSFVNSINNWYEKIKSVSNSTLQKIMKLGNAITKLVGR
jgi:DNA-binding transcriptional regulator GbsR (MarR family)|tara:strand:- start:2690 stop:3214 length:525 start_codon:yes stop_codon:yes gene_type:complete